MRHVIPLRHSLLGAVLVCLFSACGGGGGGGDAGASAGGGGGSGGTPGAGTRSVPGYTVGAKHITPVLAGQPCTIRLTVIADAGQPAVQSLGGWLGSDSYVEPTGVIAATSVAGVADTWQLVVTVPNPLLPTATVWLRITAADGSIMEVGRNGFELVGLPGG